MSSLNHQKDSAAWIIQSWAAFVISVSMTTVGIINLPTNNWIKGYMSMGVAFLTGSTFTLAKTMRDLHESRKIVARIDEAKVEKLLAEHDSLLK